MIYAVVPHYDSSGDESFSVSQAEVAEERYYENIKQRAIAVSEAYNFDFYPPIFYVVFKGGARELSDRMGFSDKLKDTGIVIRVRTINGWMSQSLWEWIESNDNS